MMGQKEMSSVIDISNGQEHLPLRQSNNSPFAVEKMIDIYRTFNGYFGKITASGLKL